MSRTTFQNALAEMFALISDTDGIPVAALTSLGVAKAYPFEPGAKGWIKPCSVTLFPSAIEPTDWTISTRVYVDGGLTPDAAQDFLIDVPVQVSALLAAGQGYGPDRWEMGWHPELECYIAISEVSVGREDGF